MYKIYNLKFREDVKSEWSYMNISGTKKDILTDMLSLRRMGFKDVIYGHFKVDPEGKEVKSCIKNAN